MNLYEKTLLFGAYFSLFFLKNIFGLIGATAIFLIIFFRYRNFFFKNNFFVAGNIFLFLIFFALFGVIKVLLDIDFSGSFFVLLVHFSVFSAQYFFKRIPTKSRGRWTSLFIAFLIFTLSIVVQSVFLTALDPYIDEYAHLLGAKAISETGSGEYFLDDKINDSYSRSYFITFLISFLFSIFGESLFIARFLGVFMSALTSITFYFLGEKISKNVGIISALLWIFSPWSIAVAKNVREYAYFPFFFLLTFLFLFSVFRFFCRQLSLKKSFQKNLKKSILGGIVFLLPLFYGFFLDPQSTFRQITIMYLCFFAFLFFAFLLSPKFSMHSKRLVFSLASILGLIGLFLLSQTDILFFRFAPSFNKSWANLFFGDSSTQWFYHSFAAGFFLFFIVGIAAAIRDAVKKNLVALFFVVIFVAYFYFFTFHFDRYFRPRYAFTVLIWMIPIVALGVQSSFSAIFSQIKKPTKTVGAFFLFLIGFFSVFNLSNARTAMEMNEHEYVPITNEYHDHVTPLFQKYKTKVSSDDAIICTLCEAFLLSDFAPLQKNKIFPYISTDPNRFQKLRTVVDKNSSGWIFLDWRRNNYWTPGILREDFFLGKTKIEFIEIFSGFYVYHWSQ